tara:strand:+ start:231 stop:407 length:177 start_codon:yes stop_codon:yes gene_type:complete
MKDLSKSRKKWNCLTDFVAAMEVSGSKEKVKEFVGHTVVTNKFEYKLFDGQISKTKIK